MSSSWEVDFTKILTKIDGMVALLEKEQEDDKTKQSYCGKEFRSTEEKSKTLDSKIKSLKASLVEKKEAIAKLSEDIEGLQKGVTALDESVAKASENRKAEHAEFQATGFHCFMLFRILHFSHVPSLQILPAGVLAQGFLLTPGEHVLEFCVRRSAEPGTRSSQQALQSDHGGRNHHEESL